MRTFKVARMTTGGCCEKEAENVPNDEDTDKNHSDIRTDVNTQQSESELEEELEQNPRKRLRSFDMINQNHSDGGIKMKISHISGSTGKSCINGDDHFTRSNAEIAQKRKKIDTLLDELQSENDGRLTKVLRHHEAKLTTEIKKLTEEKRHLEKQNLEWKKLVMESRASVDRATKSMEEMKADLQKISTNIQNYLSN